MLDDHYQALWVPRDASDAEIKKAYYALARECHPDLNSNDEAAKQKFQRIQRAWEVLGDPERREKYNRDYDAKYRKAPLQPPPPPPQPCETPSPEPSVVPPTSSFGANKAGAPRRKKQLSLMLQIIIGGIGGVVVAWLIVSVIRRGDREVIQAPRPVIEDPKPKSPEPPKPPKRKANTPSTTPDPVKKKPSTKTRSPLVVVPPETPSLPPPVIPQRKARGFAGPTKEEPEPDSADVAQQLDILLDSPEPKLRLAAARELRKPHLRFAFTPENLEKLLLGLSDISPDVQLEVVELLGELQDSAALPGLVKYRERSEISDKLRGQAAVSILRIAPNSPEANKAFVPYLAGGKGRLIKALPLPALSIRIEACQYLSKYGSSAKWAEPVLLDILEVTARNLDGQNAIKVFEVACDALGKLDSHEPETIKRLEQFVAGKGFISKREENLTQAKILADSAFRIATKTVKPKEARVSTKSKEFKVSIKPKVEIKVSAKVSPKVSTKLTVYSLNKSLGTQC